MGTNALIFRQAAQTVVLAASLFVLGGAGRAATPPVILGDPAELTDVAWAAFHPDASGDCQQMSIRAKAGSRYHIEFSPDLVNWTTEAIRYGYADGQILSQPLFELTQAASPPPAGDPDPPRMSVNLMMRGVPGTPGVSLSWMSLDGGAPVQYYLADKTLDPAWGQVPVFAAHDDAYSVGVMFLGSHPGVIPENIPLGPEDTAFVAAFGLLIETMNS